MSAEDYLINCKHLTEGAIRLIQMNHEDYPECYAACVKKAVDTRIPKGKTWSTWGGYRHFRELVNDPVSYTLKTNEVYLPYAMSMVAVMAIRKLRAFEPEKDSDVVIQYKMFDHLQGLIKTWTPDTKLIVYTNNDMTIPRRSSSRNWTA
ncbi:hypothetical protein V8C44DRAFT_333564 [Trichoderma aethiopicum]